MLETESSNNNIHPMGEYKNQKESIENEHICESFSGKIKVKWDEKSPMTPYAQAIYFAEFLKLTSLYEGWIKEAPLILHSNNAPRKEDVMGTAFLGILTGQRRYSHITSIRSDQILMEYFDMGKIVSEDSLRRNLKSIDEEAGYSWMLKHLKKSYFLLLNEPYILDMDVTIKTIYGNQEGAVPGYNPHKPGRPSHSYQTYFIANLRLILHVDVEPGNETSSKHCQIGFFAFIDSLPSINWPAFIRGDIAFGTDNMMMNCEERELKYLFKLRKTPNVKETIELVSNNNKHDWKIAYNGWEGIDTTIKLSGWKKERRIIILRKEVKMDNYKSKRILEEDLLFDTTELGRKKRYEYAVLITSLNDDLYAISKHYCDRADSENNFDEMKNQWGWSGFTTQDLKRCRLTARMIALIYNWWTIFMRLAVPGKHVEAISSRPLFLQGVGRMTKHGRQITVELTTPHAHYLNIAKIFTFINNLFKWIRDNAEQLKKYGIYRLILSIAFNYFLGDRPLKVPVAIDYS